MFAFIAKIIIDYMNISMKALPLWIMLYPMKDEDEIYVCSEVYSSENALCTFKIIFISYGQ